ncbi:MAG TPA: DegT/DnrJ/EryC1/StrS family aminotransferase [Fibrobacteraceae bacterium]|nr:DegT/DnrJ/EryC1/StrS family aminotransferase [Fibrobacteraceae bacterium]
MNFIDLRAQIAAYHSEIDDAMRKIVDSAGFVGGPEISALENELGVFVGSPNVIACSSGTDALVLALMGLGIGPGDEVVVPDFTFFASAEAVVLLGATPIFADIDLSTYNLTASTVAPCLGPRTKAVIAVSLFGQCADLPSLQDLSRQHGFTLVEDGAQSYGAARQGARSCSTAPISSTSFFPAKPLGGFGDGGAVFVRDSQLALHIRQMMNHGQESRYHHVSIGINGRLDALQAAVLRVKLRHFQDELGMRQQVAARYLQELPTTLGLPLEPRQGEVCTWAQFTVRHPERDRICASLATQGIPTAVHYPTPLHLQPALANFGKASCACCPNAERAAREVFSLPMHPFLCTQDQDCILQALRDAV